MILKEVYSKVLSFDKRHECYESALKFEWSEDMEKDLKEFKAEFTSGKIQAYTDI